MSVKNFAKCFLCAAMVLLLPVIIEAQSFGFEDSSDVGAEGSGFNSLPLTVRINGEISAEVKVFTDDFWSAKKIKNQKLGDIFSGNLNFSVSGSAADAVIKLKIAPAFDASFSPISLDEAYINAFFGPVSVEGGLRKVTWGRADSFGPMDVINPLDYSDLTELSDPQSIKISRPLLHVTWNIGSFTKVEGVFVPWFQGHNFAQSGRWTPGQITTMPELIASAIAERLKAGGAPEFILNSEKNKIQTTLKEAMGGDAINQFYPDMSTIEYAQGGMRFTTSLGPADFGLQYYYGRLPRPAVNVTIEDGFYIPPVAPSTPSVINPEKLNITAVYNSYHQMGIDYAQVIGGINVRMEAGANITGDLDGKDGSVYNPALFWCLGFDKDIFGGMYLNVQGSGTVRLFHDKIDANPLVDIEAGKNITSSRITFLLSRKFFHDELELKTIALWGIEDKDFLIMPGIYWSKNNVYTELLAGIFGGDTKGELGQYKDNHFIKLVLGYSF